MNENSPDINNQLNPQNNNAENQNTQNKDIEIKPMKEKKTIHGEFFVTFALIMLFFEAYLFLFHATTPFSISTLIIDIIYILIFGMVLWAFLTTMNTNPGEIPIYWGFYIGDDDNKRKRYCLICNAFKPERAHHCSICNICVLNMDHHCPWVNNCIGFYNRKFFMQLLFYVCCLVIYYDTSLIYFIIKMVFDLFKNKFNYIAFFHDAVVIICCICFC